MYEGLPGALSRDFALFEFFCFLFSFVCGETCDGLRVRFGLTVFFDDDGGRHNVVSLSVAALGGEPIPRMSGAQCHRIYHSGKPVCVHAAFLHT